MFFQDKGEIGLTYLGKLLISNLHLVLFCIFSNI